MKVLDYNGLKTLGTWLKSLKTKVDNAVSNINNLGSELDTLSYPFKNPNTVSSLAIYGVDNIDKSIVIPIPNIESFYQIEGIDVPVGGILSPAMSSFFGKNNRSEDVVHCIGLSKTSSGQQILMIPKGGSALRMYIKLLPVGDLVASPYMTQNKITFSNDTDLETMSKKYGNGQYTTFTFELDTAV